MSFQTRFLIPVSRTMVVLDTGSAGRIAEAASEPR